MRSRASGRRRPRARVANAGSRPSASPIADRAGRCRRCPRRGRCRSSAWRLPTDRRQRQRAMLARAAVKVVASSNSRTSFCSRRRLCATLSTRPGSSVGRITAKFSESGLAIATMPASRGVAERRVALDEREGDALGEPERAPACAAARRAPAAASGRRRTVSSKRWECARSGSATSSMRSMRGRPPSRDQVHELGSRNDVDASRRSTGHRRTGVEPCWRGHGQIGSRGGKVS